MVPHSSDLTWPFGTLSGLDSDDLRMTAYEIFFTACRSSPNSGRNPLTYYSTDDPDNVSLSPSKGNGVGMAVTSRLKRALGLKMIRRSPSSPTVGGSSPGMAMTLQGKPRRPMTSAEIMRQQMRVTEHSDNRLRKTLMRTLVGQMGRRAETIILPLELLRHLKPSEFNDPHEHRLWQKRQVKILEAGLLLHPSSPLEINNTFATRLRDIIDSCDIKPIDTSKNSETMRTLCNTVVSLSWRTPDNSPTDNCHWADGYPLNIHLYLVLLHSIFDHRDETLILDEVDELLELMKKTWSTLGINRSIHNLCFTWLLFEQYISTGQVEGDLLGASLAMLADVANDAKKFDTEPVYVKMLGTVLVSMKRWLEKRLVDYRGSFDRGTVGLMETILPLVFSATRILEEDVPGFTRAQVKAELAWDLADNRVDHYIRSSLRIAFAKMVEDRNECDENGTTIEVQEVSETLIKLADDTEDFAMKERETFSPILKKWHPIAAGIAAMTLHTCYGTLLKQYLTGASLLTDEMIKVLQRAGKLEIFLVQMVVEDSVDCEDGGKAIVREMVPFEVDSIILRFLREWIQERLKNGKEVLHRAKETETWNPKSKNEPYAHSAVDIMKHAKDAVEEFFEIPVGLSEDLVHDLADGLEHLFREYTTFVASCGSKQSYIPTLPPLTRCSRDSKFIKLWKKASPCTVSIDSAQHGSNEGNHPRPSTSRGTQRLYIRLNTLHYLLSHLHSIDKTLSLPPKIAPSSSSYFDNTCSSIHMASQHVSEVAAYRLIFLDSNPVFYGSLYVADVENCRIRPALRILKQNLTLLAAIVTDRAQPMAVKEVMKASFEAFLMVLLAGGSSRIFSRSDYKMVEEDFDHLKRVFCLCGEGLVAENVADREADVVEGVVGLMSQSTDQLVEDFSIVACEVSGIGMMGAGQKLPMPPTTGKWNRADPNTILRVLCHRNDKVANHFLKRTFQLAKRRL